MEPTIELHMRALVKKGYILHSQVMEQLPKFQAYADCMNKVIDKLERESGQLRREKSHLIEEHTKLKNKLYEVEKKLKRN